jgi:hypothetical protein
MCVVDTADSVLHELRTAEESSDWLYWQDVFDSILGLEVCYLPKNRRIAVLYRCNYDLPYIIVFQTIIIRSSNQSLDRRETRSVSVKASSYKG